ncbi:MAG TPA: hypothetical protein PLL28_11625 [Chitinophagales bacterium]|nr:hypothetical protein [Chitinophagales bacterium]HMZ88637.1 hypothetical protein [Chitinophagales bacterium]HNE44708.1 hypothetical protein [Chitinophagales bacterium]HNF70018.1 hypothetical protein [Chitinophagales bacterium]
MKINNLLNAFILCFSILTTVFVLDGCEPPGCTREYNFTGEMPVYMTYEELRASVYLDAPKPIDSSNAFCISDPYLFVSDFEKGVHVYDCTIPENPQDIGFIHVPGVTQLAAVGSRLYVNSYVDLVVLDISDIHAIHETGRVENTLTYRTYGSIFADPSKGVIIGFEERDTVIVEECGYHSSGIGMVYYDEPYLYMPYASGKQSGYLSYYKANGDSLICFDEGTIRIFDVNNSDNPTVSFTTEVGGTYTVEPIGEYFLIGNSIYTSPASNQLNYLSYLSEADYCSKIVVNQNYCYAANRTTDECYSYGTNLVAINIDYVTSPNYLDYYTDVVPNDVFTLNDWVFVIHDHSELRMYHIEADGTLTLFDSIPVENAEYVKASENTVIVDTNPGYKIYTYNGTSGLEYASYIPE